MSELRSVNPCLAVLIALVLTAAPASGQNYCLTNLGTLGNQETRPNDINNSTEIVGESWVVDLAYGYHQHPFHWASGTMQDLGTVFAGQNTTVNAINEYGWIVGTARDPSGNDQPYYTFAVPGATWSPIFHPGDSAVARDVNDNVWMVGTFFEASGPGAGPHAYAHHPRFGIFDLGDVEGAGRSEAFTINNKGQIGGSSSTLVGDCAAGFHVPVIWEETGFTQWTVNQLPTDGECIGVVMAINESDVAVGFTHNPLFPSPVVWRRVDAGWEIEFLPAGELGLGSALDVNESGQIVGFSSGATLWENGQEIDLDSLIDLKAWELLAATGINDQGQILGTGLFGGEVRAYLLTPQPPGVACF